MTATTAPTDTTSTNATPVQIGEQLVHLLRAANGCTAQVVARQPGVYDHLHEALLELLRTQGWGPRQAEEVIMAVILDPSATLQETMRLMQAPVVTPPMAEQVRVAACKQLDIDPDSPHGPQLLPEWDDPDRQWVIAWTAGEWTYMFPDGGCNEDGIEFPEVQLPTGVWVERISDYAITVFHR
ncbi:hypothetical protein [Nonomuraea sp. LPB2021202275-12-8]|uniref:hypothetical protein n=1 Tax=Nonomuraea sp. LPB2021202275-12-8 TaxID=3120159 RepID=UPI00300C3189